MATKAKFVELDTFAAENFDKYVFGPSSRVAHSKESSRFSNHVVEVATYYKGSKILGYCRRGLDGYRYYMRKAV